MVKKFLLIVLIILLVVTAGGFYLITTMTADVTTEETIELTIEEGSGTATIASLLEERGLICNAQAFRLFAKTQNVDSLFKAGEYSFASGLWSMADVCTELVAGGISEGDSIRVTIPEGLTAEDSFVLLEAAGIGTVSDYLYYAKNGDFSKYTYIPAAADVVEPGNRLEGFLFPNTYMLDPSWQPEEVVDMLLAQFYQVWTENGFDTRAAEMEYSDYELVTMASIVEKEAQVPADRPVIAGVFYKRLDLGWMLESCATIQFLLDEPKEVLLYSDLEIVSPYNTYRNAGLPPGPIASPGLASLQAALYPEETDYLYFRARTDGSHRFSTTLTEHETYHDGDQ